LLCGAKPLLFCSSLLDADERYGSGGTLGSWAAASTTMIESTLPPSEAKETPRINKQGQTAEHIAKAWNQEEKSTTIQSCPISLAMACSGQTLYAFCSDIWLMLQLEGIVLDTRPAQDNRESVTEPDQCLGGLRGWHFEESKRLKPAGGTCALVETPTFGFLLQHAQINENMFNSHKLFSLLEPDPAPEFVEYTSPGLTADFQARLVLAPATGAVFFSYHYNNYFHCTIGSDLEDVYKLLKIRLIPWFKTYDKVGLPDWYADLKALPSLVAAKGAKTSTKPVKKEKKQDKDQDEEQDEEQDEKEYKLSGLGLHVLDLADCCSKLPKEHRDELIDAMRELLSVETKGKTIGRPRATWLFADGKTNALQRLNKGVLADVPSFKLARDCVSKLLRRKKDQHYKNLETLHSLLETCDRLLAGPSPEQLLHRAAALNLMWYMLKQSQEVDAVGKALEKRVQWADSPQGDHLLNDLSGRVRRTEANCGIHVFRLERKLLKLLRQSRALRANMFPASLLLDLSSNANLWSFASDYFECALALRIDAEGASEVEGGLSAALVVLLRCCIDRSVATRIDSVAMNGAHWLSTGLLGAKGCVEAKNTATTILGDLIAAIAQIEGDMEDQITGIFSSTKK
jgi:hypothetical protein